MKPGINQRVVCLREFHNQHSWFLGLNEDLVFGQVCAPCPSGTGGGVKPDSSLAVFPTDILVLQWPVSSLEGT